MQVFDPHFFPSVCIDKPTAFGRSPMISMVSINLLQNLDLTGNIYVKEHSANYLPMDDQQASLNFETDTDDSDAGSIKLSHPATALNTQKSKSSDDLSSTHTEIIAESSEFLENSCPRSGGACSEQSGVSLEQGYVQLPHYQQEPVLSASTITRLDCPSDDSDSVLTQVLSKGYELKECSLAQLQVATCSTSGYVQSNILHTARPGEQEMHTTTEYSIMQSSEFSNSMPVSEGMHSNGGYIQSSAVSIPTPESKEEPTNLLELLLNDETCESEDDDSHHDLHVQQTLQLTLATTEGCKELSVYFHPANFHSAISDYVCDHPKDTLNHSNITDQQVEIADNSHSESPVAFHPPTTMDNEARSDTSTTCTHGGPLPGESECLHPTNTLSSGVFTNSSTESTDTTDSDLSTYGYIPSELFTRKILIPASHDQDSTPAAAAGFVVHLDFENRHEILPRTINNQSQTHQQVN
jgi:hypothetical protein